MKIALSILVFVIFGVGEYAFVQLAPFPPERRVQRVKKFPIVRTIVKAQDMRLVDQAIADSENGNVSINRNGEVRTWSSAKDLFADVEQGDFTARVALERVRNQSEWLKGIAETRTRAEQGDPSAMRQLYYIGKTITGQDDMDRAEALLAASDTAIAKWYLEITLRRSVEQASREGMLLYARMMQESYRSPIVTDEQYAKIVDQNNRYLNILRDAADNGAEDARWVVEQLAHESGEVRLDA